MSDSINELAEKHLETAESMHRLADQIAIGPPDVIERYMNETHGGTDSYLASVEKMLVALEEGRFAFERMKKSLIQQKKLLASED